MSTSETPRYRCHLGCILLNIPAISAANSTMLWSDNLGRSWTRFGPERNVSRAMAGQWSVLPRMQQLPSGELLLSGGRPGIFVWVGGRDEGREWRRVNICAEHNAGLTPALRAGWGFEPTLAALEPWAAPVPNEHDGPCCEPPDLAPKALSPSDPIPAQPCWQVPIRTARKMARGVKPPATPRSCLWTRIARSSSSPTTASQMAGEAHREHKLVSTLCVAFCRKILTSHNELCAVGSGAPSTACSPCGSRCRPRPTTA